MIALKAAQAGALVVLVARSLDKLEAVRKEIAELGGVAHVYAADLSMAPACDELLQRLREADIAVDVLINNAGRSIRRPIDQCYDRLHDFERTMALNYFGALRLIMGLLPGMRARKSGHIIDVSSESVQVNAPRFSAYVASKAALDAFSRAAAVEVLGDNVHFTTVYMPLVRTPMIAPTKVYDAFPALSPERAADMVLKAVLHRPKIVTTRVGSFVQAAYTLAPKLVDRAFHIGVRLFPDEPRADATLSPAPSTLPAIGLGQLVQAVHW
jgi:short-subunit dehydrogenase